MPRPAAIAAQAGIVITHANPMSRTTPHATWRACRAAPTPTTEEDTTCVVLAGAPTAEAAPMMSALLAEPTMPSSGRSR